MYACSGTYILENLVIRFCVCNGYGDDSEKHPKYAERQGVAACCRRGKHCDGLADGRPECGSGVCGRASAAAEGARAEADGGGANGDSRGAADKRRRPHYVVLGGQWRCLPVGRQLRRRQHRQRQQDNEPADCGLEGARRSLRRQPLAGA